MSLFCFFFLNDPATTEIYTLSLHDALTICSRPVSAIRSCGCTRLVCPALGLSRAPSSARASVRSARSTSRSEEHTSELQSLRHLVCRLLLAKKKDTSNIIY